MKLKRGDLVYETVEGGLVKARVVQIMRGGSVALVRFSDDGLPESFQPTNLWRHGGYCLFDTSNLTLVDR